MDGAPSLKSGLSSWRGSKAHGDGAPRNTDAVGTIRYAAPRIGAPSSVLFLHCAKQPPGRMILPHKLRLFQSIAQKSQKPRRSTG